MKAIVTASILSFLLIAIPVAFADLRDCTNLAVSPGSVKCIDIEVPDDVGAVGAFTSFAISSDCGDWCDFTAASVITDPASPATIPLCVNTLGRQFNETKQFKVIIDPLNIPSKRREFNYGICVSDKPDVDRGCGSPCAIVTSTQKFFTIEMDPITYVEAGKDSPYEAKVCSSTDGLDLEISSDISGKMFSTTTKRNECKTLRDTVNVDKDTPLTLTATLKGCSAIGCTKTSSTMLTIGKPVTPSGNFSAKIFPEDISTKKGEQVKIYLEISNFGDERPYTVNLSLPDGLKSDFNGTTKMISNKDTIIIGITPEASTGLYEFTLAVNGPVTKLLKGTITVNELATDLERLKSAESIDPDTLNSINAAIVNSGSSSVIDDVNAFSDITNKKAAAQAKQPLTASKQQPKAEGPDMAMVIVAVVAVIVIILVIALKMSPRRHQPKKPWDRDWEKGRY